MALVTRGRAQEIALRWTGEGVHRGLANDVQDLLETIKKLTGALEETLKGWHDYAMEDFGHNFIASNPIYQRNQCFLDALKGVVPVQSYHPVAVCLECGWEHRFRRVIGVNEALVASALVEEAQAIHGGLCRLLRIELRPVEATPAELSPATTWFVAHCVCGWTHTFSEMQETNPWARREEYIELAKAEHACSVIKEIGLQLFTRGDGNLSVSVIE